MHKFLVVLLKDLVSLKRPVTASAVASLLIIAIKPFGWSITVVQVSEALVIIGTVAAAIEYKTLDWHNLIASAKRLLGPKGEAKVLGEVERFGSVVLHSPPPMTATASAPTPPATSTQSPPSV